ncbi:MAG TPA: CHAT domain-containing protein, partial [Thermoanaerobaculia bacterium]
VREEAFHVVHFVGHAAFDPESGKGRLLLEGADGSPNPVSAENLAFLLRGLATPQLLVLNACQTATFSWEDGHDPWSGLAAALLVAGFPAVVAMQFPITDKAAVIFSRGFYGRLAAGHPVDLAIAGGREAISLANSHSLEWATPVLFLRGMAGDLFRIRISRPRQQSVMIEAQREHQDIPKYEDQLINNLAENLKIAPSDIQSTGTDKGGRYKLTLPANAARRLLEASKSSEFSHSRAAFYIDSIQTTHTWSDWASYTITFFLGILGNLIASALQEGPLHGSFTIPRVALLFLLTLVFLRWNLFARIQERLGPKRVIATLGACAVLLVVFALFAWLVPPPPPNCDVSRVELDLPKPVALNLSGNRITDLNEQDLQGIQRLSGRAALYEPGARCRCEWRGKTDRDQILSSLGSSANCDFTIDLPSQYNWIFLQLKVGDKTDLFTIHVH